jgi:hypothetical protein
MKYVLTDLKKNRPTKKINVLIRDKFLDEVRRENIEKKQRK